MSELREWMIKNCGGCPDKERSDESYALEFLKTFKANLAYHQKRTNLAIVSENLAYHRDWITDQIGKADKLLGELKSFPQ